VCEAAVAEVSKSSGQTERAKTMNVDEAAVAEVSKSSGKPSRQKP
jgi:hypothetical protein